MSSAAIATTIRRVLTSHSSHIAPIHTGNTTTQPSTPSDTFQAICQHSIGNRKTQETYASRALLKSTTLLGEQYQSLKPAKKNLPDNMPKPCHQFMGVAHALTQHKHADPDYTEKITQHSRDNVIAHRTACDDMYTQLSAEELALLKTASNTLKTIPYTAVHFTKTPPSVKHTGDLRYYDVRSSLSLEDRIRSSSIQQKLRKQSTSNKPEQHTTPMDRSRIGTEGSVCLSLEPEYAPTGGKQSSRFGPNKMSFPLSRDVNMLNLTGAVILKNDPVENFCKSYASDGEKNDQQLLAQHSTYDASAFFKISDPTELPDILALIFEHQLLSVITKAKAIHTTINTTNTRPTRGSEDSEILHTGEVAKNLLKQLADPSEDTRLRAIEWWLSGPSKIQILVPGGMICLADDVKIEQKKQTNALADNEQLQWG